MKYFLIILFLLTANLFAMTIDEEIQAVSQANPKERYKLMNALKQRIASMNAQDRQAIIHQMRSQHKPHGTTTSPNALHHQKTLRPKTKQQGQKPQAPPRQNTPRR
jgi:hypothetical protein